MWLTNHLLAENNLEEAQAGLLEAMKTCAAKIAGTRAINTIEPLKNTLRFVFRDANTVIFTNKNQRQRH